MSHTNSGPSETRPRPYAFSEQRIGSAWRVGGGDTVLKVSDPYNGQELATIPRANLKDVNDAFEAAQRAQREWADTLPTARSTVLRKAAHLLELRSEEVVDWLIKESGSTRTKAVWELSAVKAIIMEASTLPTRVEGRILSGDIAYKENRIYRKPLGVIAVISPWNWPLHLSSRAIMSAIAVGNSVVLKPSEETPVTGGLLFARLLEDAGLPEGVLNVVVGKASEIGDAFVSHPIPRAISFTGSSAVGRRVGLLAVTGPLIKRTMLELGGNASVIILDDADLDLAVDAAVSGKFFHQGQICIAANKFLVDQSIYGEFVEAYTARVRKLKFGDPNESDTALGPVINRKQLTLLEDAIAAAKAEGARERVGGAAQDLVLPPHVFDLVRPGMRLGAEELFGPIAPVISVSGPEEAVALANETEFGLSGSIFSRNIERAMGLAHQVDAGMTHINDMPVVDMANMPFGGEKNSGIGRYGSEALIEELTTQHWISVQHRPRPYPF